MRTEQVFITCDECGAIDASELRFAVNGRNHAIDLCVTHRAIFDTLIQTYITNGHAVRFNGHAIRKDAPKPIVDTASPKKVRKSRAKVAEPVTEQTEELVSG